MSASRERKKRVEQMQQTPASQTPTKEKKKLSDGVVFAIVTLSILAVFLCGVFGYSIWNRNQTVMTVGDHEIKVKEFNYFLGNVANNYYSYASYLGLDAETPLAELKITEENMTYLPMIVDTSYLSDFTPVDGVYDVTMAQLLANSAKEMAAEAYGVYNVAIAEGYELDEDCQEELAAELDSLKESGKAEGLSLRQTIKRIYGSGASLGGYRDFMEVVHVAQHYPGTLSYSAEELNARYEESPESFDVASLYVYSTAAANYVEADEEGNTPEPSEAEEALAKKDAEDMANSFDTENEKVKLYTDYTSTAVTSLCGEDAAAWLFEEAAVDGTSVKLFENDGTYHVLKLIDKSDYLTANVLQIYIADDAAEPAEGELSAEKKLELITSALTSDASQESFKALAEDYAEEGAEIEVENLSRSALSGVAEEAFFWACMEERAVGDWQQFEVSGGTIVLMFNGYGMGYRDSSVTSTISSEWVEAQRTAAVEACGYNEEAALKSNVVN
ncbi:MAG: hypothetical protein IJB35_00675 [Oscillospiraceae bacterium]|nr:hypothetical protein [Oscillospiraceae bacterium]